MLRRLCDCFESVTEIDNGSVYIFTPSLGNYKLEYTEDIAGFNYRLTIPFEDKNITIILDDEKLKKLSVLLGIGSKHFDVLIQSEEKIIENLNEMLTVSEQDFYFLVEGTAHAVKDVSVNTEPVKISEILDCLKQWYKTGTDDSDPNNKKDWTEETLNDQLCVYYYSNSDNIVSLGVGLKYKDKGCFIKCNRLGSIKPTIWPCVFKKQCEQEYIPIIFDINGITETKPTFRQNVDIQTNVSTIISENEDFLYDISRKLNFELARSIDPEQYLKHLSSETKIPKKYIKKGIITGLTIKTIVDTICSECYNLLHTDVLDDSEYVKNMNVFEKLCKASGYAIFYQDRFCNCCFKTATLAEDNNN